MPRTILFFGDSATRGYGVGRELRFAERVATDLAAMPWRFTVAASSSDFAVYRKRLIAELEGVRPEVLVCQCPVGPACFFPRFPPWARAVIAVRQRVFERLTDRYVDRELHEHGAAGRTRHESLYEGRYLDRLHRWQPSNWPVVGRVWRARVSRYPTIPKLTCEGYVGRMQRLQGDARERGVRRLLFVGLLPVAESVCPGYFARVPLWCVALRAALDDPSTGCRFLDVFGPLHAVSIDRLLLRDRVHLSPEGHRLLANLVRPALEPLLAA